MVKIDFERPGLDCSWGAVPKCLDGFATDSTAMDPRSSSTELQEFRNVDVELIWQFWQLMTVLAEEFAKEKNVDLKFNPDELCEPMTNPAEEFANETITGLELIPKEDFELVIVPVDDSGNETNIELDLNQNEYRELMTKGLVNEENADQDRDAEDHLQLPTQIAPAHESASQGLVMVSEGVPPGEWQENIAKVREQIELDKKARQHEQDKSTHRSGFDCWLFFTNMFKPQPSTPAFSNPDPLERALLESASLNEAKALSVDHARGRLQKVMEKYQAQVRPVGADGNCQFRALALQLYGDESQHGELRARTVTWLQEVKERYSDFVHEPFGEYIQRMGCDGQWGDNVTLQAASDMLSRDIHVLNDQPGSEHITLHPSKKADDMTEEPLWLAFLAEVHYDAVQFL